MGHASGYGGRETLWSTVSNTGTSTSGAPEVRGSLPCSQSHRERKEGGLDGSHRPLRPEL